MLEKIGYKFSFSYLFIFNIVQLKACTILIILTDDKTRQLYILLTFSSVKYLSSFKYSWSGKWVLGVLRSKKPSIKACQCFEIKFWIIVENPLIKHCIIDVNNGTEADVEKTGINLSELKKILKFRLRKFQDYMIKPIRNYKIKTLLLKRLCSFLLVYTVTMHLTS